MTAKELKKLNRKQLLELLLIQTKEINALNERVSELEEKLQDRKITQSEVGSIAEAALKLNGIFETAQAAADQYLENVRRQNASEPAKDEEEPSGEEITKTAESMKQGYSKD